MRRRVTPNPLGHARRERTRRMLAATLESIARRSEHSLAGVGPLDADLARARAATRNAVRLGLLTAGEARELWQDAATRHPGARGLEPGE